MKFVGRGVPDSRTVGGKTLTRQRFGRPRGAEGCGRSPRPAKTATSAVAAVLRAARGSRRRPRRPLENLDSTVFAPFIDRYSPFSTVFAVGRSARIVKPNGRSTVFGAIPVRRKTAKTAKTVESLRARARAWSRRRDGSGGGPPKRPQDLARAGQRPPDLLRRYR